MEGIIIGVITALSAVVCQLIIAKNNTKNVEQTQQNSQRLIEYKIDKLSERVDKHNNVVERMALAEKDITVVNHRIHDLEEVLKCQIK